MRLDKFLCECNIGTRSEVKKIIKTGKVLVNGEGIKQADYKIDENTDEVKYNGEILKYETNVYFLLNKPAGYVTAKKDNLYKTVMELIPQEFRKKCSPVGRLDLDTEGLLLITDDGALNHRLMSPAHHVEKTYYARLDKKIEDDEIEKFKEGVDIGDYKLTLPAKLELLDGRDEAYLTISEGRYHQVKRMFEAVGAKVTYLKRVKLSFLELDDLEPGEYRRLTGEEIKRL